MQNNELTFRKTERISASKDIRAVFNRGKKVNVPGAKLFFVKNEQSVSRFAVTFPRGYGNAVMRNKTKRLCRESFRLQKARILSGYDLLFLLYQCEGENFDARYRQMRTLCKKAGLTG